MRYLPHTDEEIAEMLKLLGKSDIDDLFVTIPEECRCTDILNLPTELTEWELDELMEDLSANIAVPKKYKIFLGAGSYDHYIPETLMYLLSRSEFVTAYTPYQPEMSQGTLQAMYEYQTMVARLLGMEVANASLYDGASALAEAILMAIRITRKNSIAVSRAVHPHYRAVVATYLGPTGCEIQELPFLENGRTDISTLHSMDDLAGIVVQSPNFIGCIENLKLIGEEAHRNGALFITSFTEPLAYGLLKNPGSLGADVACGEGQSLGIPQSFGGPGLGMFATKMNFVRNIPGRLVGKAVDMSGRPGFVLTLAAREQHIRREKATSNICTNSNLCALAAAMYMALTGGSGIKELAALNHDKAEYLKRRMLEAGFMVSFRSPTFNEFVIEIPGDHTAIYERLLEKKIVAGLPLVSFYPELENHYLLCVTETKTKEDLDALIQEVAT